MKVVKTLIRRMETCTDEEALTLVTTLGKSYSNYIIKLYILITSTEVMKIVVDGKDTIVIEPMALLPLARSHQDFINYYSVTFDSNSGLSSFTDVIDSATYLLDQMLTEDHELAIIRCIDKKNYTADRIVFPTILRNSDYISSVAATIVGDSAKGEAITPNGVVVDVGEVVET